MKHIKILRWPGVIKPGTVCNDIFAHNDMLPTLVAAAGEPDIVDKLKQGYKAGNKIFKVHIDDYNLIPFLKGEVKVNPRPGFLYWSDDGDLMGLSYRNWKMDFMVQRAHGFHVWAEPLVSLRVPLITNLRSNLFEMDDEDVNFFYNKWFCDRAFVLVAAQGIMGGFLNTFEDFPPRQRPSSFSIGDALERARKKHDLLASASGGGVK